jgi:DNA-binding XRE family transcriptional regulator
MTNHQTIHVDGKPAFVVIPIDEWRRIVERLEGREDVAALEAFRRDKEETFPIAVADALIAGENPVLVYRKHRGMTQVDLAGQCDIAVPYLSQIENGKRKASAAVLRKLAEALSVSMDDL